MSLDDLPISEYNDRLSNFLPQMEMDMCESASMANSINDLGLRFNIAGMRYSLRKMNRICQYSSGYQCNQRLLLPRIKNELKKFGYTWKTVEGPDIKFDFLRSLLSGNYSIPIVNVSKEYFVDLGIKIKSRHDHLDHVLVIMGINHEILYYYDPYVLYFEKTHKSINNVMKIEKFINYWDNAYYSRWVSWAEPLRPPYQKDISEFLTK